MVIAGMDGSIELIIPGVLCMWLPCIWLCIPGAIPPGIFDIVPDGKVGFMTVLVAVAVTGLAPCIAWLFVVAGLWTQLIEPEGELMGVRS